MADPLTYKKFIAVHGNAGNVPVWVVCPDDPDVYILTTLEEFWSRQYEDSAQAWKEVFK